MKMKILFAFVFFVIFSIAGVYAQTQSYGLKLEFIEGVLEFKDLSLIYGEAPGAYNGTEYILNIYNNESNLLYSDSFDKPLIFPDADPSWFDEEGNQIFIPEYTEPENVSLTLFLPYFENGKYIKIEKNSELVLEIDIKNYIACDYDNICDDNENANTCAEDCVEIDIDICEGADLDNSGSVNWGDFSIFAAHWLEQNCSLESNYCSGADLDKSGSVNWVDFSIFASHWLDDCTGEIQLSPPISSDKNKFVLLLVGMIVTIILIMSCWRKIKS